MAANTEATNGDQPKVDPIDSSVVRDEDIQPQIKTEKSLTDSQKLSIENLKPTWFERTVVQYPCICCWSWCAFAMLFAVLTGAFVSSGKLAFDQRGVWDVRSHEVQKQFDAFMLARSEIKKNESAFSQFTPQSQNFHPLYVVYYSEDETENFLTASQLQWMKEIEDKVAATSYSDKCVFQPGVDTTQQAITFANLDASTNMISADRQPGNNTVVVFSGTSSKLIDGGMYTVWISSIGAGEFKLHTIDSNLVASEVDFSNAGDISAGARFLPTKKVCGSAESVLNHAYPNADAQKELYCNGFLPKSTTNDVPVIGKVCGCAAGSIVHDAGPTCAQDCTSHFGKNPFCMSTAYVPPGADNTQAIADANLAKMCPNAAGLSPSEKMEYKNARQSVLPKDWTCSSTGAPASAKIVRSLFWIGGPLEGYTRTAGDTVEDQMDDLLKWTKDNLFEKIQEISKEAHDKAEGTSRVVIMAPIMVRLVFDSIMSTDGILAFGSIWFVFMWTWCSTGSFLLAAGTIFETFISLPMAMATWGCFNQKYLGFLTVMMIFVILGIGADDVFVLVDAWKQSGLQPGIGDDLQVRFCYAYRRARDAMMVTTMTTFFGFFAAGLSNVPSVSGFGYFAALVVFWDYIMCITFFASLVVVYHKYFERKNACCTPCCPGRCAGHMGCCPLKCLGSEEPKHFYKKPRLVAPLVVLLVLGFAIAFFQPFFGCLLFCGGLIYIYSTISAQADSSTARPVERFFETYYFSFAKRHKYKLLGCSSTIFVACAVIAVLMLRLPTEEEPFLSDTHPLQIYLESGSFFDGSGTNPMSWVYVTFGIDKENALDRSGVDYQQPGTGFQQNLPEEPLGVVQYSSAARQAMVSVEGQKEIVQLCDSLRETPTVTVYDEDCEWVVHRGVGYPRFVPSKASLLNSNRLRTVTVAGTEAYLEVTGNDALTDVSTGFCASGVYCFMYSVRDYVVNFCDGAGLKNQWVASRGNLFSSLCVDVNGNTITGGTSAFPTSDLDAVMASAGFKLYEDVILKEERLKSGMSYDEFVRNRMTNKRLVDGKLQFAFIGMNGSIPTGEFPYSEQKKLYELFQDYFASKLKVNSEAFFSSFVFNWMLITEALMRNTFQSMALGLVFCVFVACLMTWNVWVALLAVSSVVMVVAIGVGFICLMGWKLGIIEAIVLIVIVGISVDYSVHIAHAYNHAFESSTWTATEAREKKTLAAVQTMGISLVSGVATSMGAAVFLWFCEVSFFRKFGQFLMTTLVISFSITFGYLIPVLLAIGPVQGRGVLPTIPLPCLKKSESTNGDSGKKAKEDETSEQLEAQKPKSTTTTTADEAAPKENGQNGAGGTWTEEQEPRPSGFNATSEPAASA
jgi:predicted RND superfamily exporter protein